MSWGVDLWDQLEVVSAHTQKGIDFCDKYHNFLKERSIIELDYAAKIRKLVKSYQTRQSKTEEPQFSYEKGFSTMLSEIRDMAGQREVVVESINGTIVKDIQLLLLDLRQSRKKHLQDGAKLELALQNQLNELDKVHKQSEKAFKDSEKAKESYKKSEADIHLSRADVEKAKNLMRTRAQQCEQAKGDYATVLLATNRAQAEHYQNLMPQVFQNLQTLGEKCISKVKEFVLQTAQIESRIIPIINVCISGIKDASASIDPIQDSQLLIDTNKTGFEQPGDIEFIDNGTSSTTTLQNGGSHGTLSSPGTLLRSSVRRSQRSNSVSKGTLSHSRTRKRSIFGVFGSQKGEEEKDDFSHLPPTQQRKKLLARLDTLKNQITTLESERSALAKMQEVYRKNPKLGNPNTLIKQLEENGQALDQLKKELQKYESSPQDFRPHRYRQNTLARYRSRLMDSQKSYYVGAETRDLRSESLSNSESNVSLTSSTQQLSLPITPNTPSTPVTPSTPTSSVSVSAKTSPPARTTSVNNTTNNKPVVGVVSPSSRDEDVVRYACSPRHSSSSGGAGTGRQNSSATVTSSAQRLTSPLDTSDLRDSTFSGPRDSTLSSGGNQTDSFENYDDEDEEEVANEADQEPVQPIGTCVALYAFQATSEGSMDMKLGERFNVLEQDGGDGWTRVQRLSNQEIGFVPTSYVQCRIQTSV